MQRSGGLGLAAGSSRLRVAPVPCRGMHRGPGLAAQRIQGPALPALMNMFSNRLWNSGRNVDMAGVAYCSILPVCGTTWASHRGRSDCISRPLHRNKGSTICHKTLPREQSRRSQPQADGVATMDIPHNPPPSTRPGSCSPSLLRNGWGTPTGNAHRAHENRTR